MDKNFDKRTEYKFVKLNLSNALLEGNWIEAKKIIASRKLDRSDVKKLLSDFLHTEDVQKVYERTYGKD